MMKTKKAQHTPTPWSWNVNYIVQGNVPNANNAHIVMPLYRPTTRSKYEGRADAEFIVRAVNAHEALLEIVKELHVAIQRGGDLQLGPKGRNAGLEEKVVLALAQAEVEYGN